MDDALRRAALLLPPPYDQMLLSRGVGAEDIRLRLGKPVSYTAAGTERVLNEDAKLTGRQMLWTLERASAASLYAVQDSRPGLAAVMTAFCLFWGTTSSAITSFCGLNLYALTHTSPWNALLSPWLKLQTLALCSLPLILIRFRHNLHLPVWAGYAMYPLHLLVLWGLEIIL